MKQQSQAVRWQDWAVFGMRLALALIVAAAVYVLRSRQAPVPSYTEFIVAFAAVGAANLLLVAAMYIPAAQRALPIVTIVGDWVSIAGLTYLTGGDMVLVIGIMGAVAVSGLLRLGLLWGALQIGGMILVAGAVLALALDQLRGQVDLMPYLPAATGMLAVIVASGVWVYLRDEYSSVNQKRLNEIQAEKQAELEDMRERARAVSDMATALSSTLNYQKIVDAALDVGNLSLRKGSKTRTISLVLLFNSDLDDRLHIVGARGLSRNDDRRTFSSKSGIIGRTLDECVPIVGKDALKDPQLSQLVSFQNIKSLLCIPLRAGFDNYGVLLYGTGDFNAFTEDHLETLNAIGIQTTIALQNSVLYTNLMEEKERIIEMEENARKSLVRDLHDVPTQTIAAVAMRIRIIQKLIERGQHGEVNSELKTVEDMALRATEEIRHVLFKLRPLALESQGLTAALDQLAEKMQKTYKQAVTVKVVPEIETLLDGHGQGVLFYLIEEAVNNARKYAEAKLISVAVGRKSADVIMVRIADNGVGFDMQAVNAGYDQRGSFGMVNMRERAELLDGTLTVESAPGRGTTITVLIPVPGSRDDAPRFNGSVNAVPQSKIMGNTSQRTSGTPRG